MKMQIMCGPLCPTVRFRAEVISILFVHINYERDATGRYALIVLLLSVPLIGLKCLSDEFISTTFAPSMYLNRQTMKMFNNISSIIQAVFLPT